MYDEVLNLKQEGAFLVWLSGEFKWKSVWIFERCKAQLSNEMEVGFKSRVLVSDGIRYETLR